MGEGVYAPPCKVNNCFMMLATQIFHAIYILFTRVGSRGVEAVDAPLSPLSVVLATGLPTDTVWELLRGCEGVTRARDSAQARR